MARGKVSTKGLNKVSNHQVVLDTSAIIFLSDRGYRSGIAAAIDQLEAQNNECFVSELTLYELNKSSTTQSDVTAKSKILNRFSPLQITQGRLILAGVLFSTMKACSSGVKNKERSIGCDMLIGGTVVENSNALLMTSNLDDFCPPCWKIVAEGRVVKKVSTGWKLDNWYLLEFDYSKMPSEFMSEELQARFHRKQEVLALPLRSES